MGKDIPLSLVKFTPAELGLSVLQSKTLRWSAPHVFCDPFENSAHTALGFGQYDLTKAAVRAIAAMIFSRNDPMGEANPIKKAVRRWRAEDRFHSEEEAEEALSELLPTMISQRYAELEAYMHEWELYAYNARVLCLADTYEDMSCWQLFADHHRGIAIRFKVGEENCVKNPCKVAYRSVRNVVTTLREQVGIFTGEITKDESESLEEKLLVKPKQLSGQKEWRCIYHPNDMVDPKSGEMSVSYDDRPFSVQEVSAVYLGACIDDIDREKILDVLGKDYSKVKVYEAHAKESEYLLEFEKIEGVITKDSDL